MKRKTKAFFVFGVVSLVLALATDRAAAQAITVTAVQAGAFHTCALLQDATPRCWGLNDYGQLGNGTIANPFDFPNPIPAPVVGIASAVAVTGGGLHTCARFPDGTPQCWGRSSEGQLGGPANTGLFSATPVEVTGITTATAVASGAEHSCALLLDGRVQCWGGTASAGSATGPPPMPSPL